jgi:hypothetical protein
MHGENNSQYEKNRKEYKKKNEENRSEKYTTGCIHFSCPAMKGYLIFIM